LVVVAGHLPLRGEETVIERASIVPVAVSVPIADAHSPLLSAEGAAVAVVENDVAEVVFTFVDLALEPKIDVTTNEDPEIDEIVPNAPPKPRPPKPRPPTPPPALLDPVGAGIGRPLKPPLGGVPLPPPNPPPPEPPPPNPLAGHPEVLVTDTLVAVITVGAVALLLVGVLATETQSPLASEDSETAEILANLVEEAQATVEVPVVDLTVAVEPPTDTTMPDTPPKLAENWGRLGSGDVVVDTEPDVGLELEPPPHAATRIAVTARPAADSTHRRGLGFRFLVMSLTSQRIDRSEPGGARGGIDPEADPDGDCHHDRAEGRGG
jgi:hypothetical protein